MLWPGSLNYKLPGSIVRLLDNMFGYWIPISIDIQLLFHIPCHSSIKHIQLCSFCGPHGFLRCMELRATLSTTCECENDVEAFLTTAFVELSLQYILLC